jgi:4-amino-4-deoxy-L-arabinose transferase-like glycosyltransferase
LRITAWSIVAPLLLLLASLTIVLYRNRAGFDVPVVHILLTLGIVSVSLGLRSFDYELVPDFRDNGDELFAAWNGFSLLDEGKSRGWSLWYARYGDKVQVQPTRWMGTNEFKVITPYFEHPPLLHLLAGAAAKLGGAKHWIETQHRYTRLVPVLLSVLCTWLVIAIGRSLSPKSAGPYLGGLLYAAVPTIALQGRVVKEEALLTFLMLLGCLCFLRYRQHGLMRDLIFASLAFGLCALTKVTGVVFVPVLVMWLTAERAYREAIIAGAIGLSVSALLLVYGAILDWDNFWFATVYQAVNRPSHFNILLRFFDDALINQTLIGRGWLLFLWLAFVSWVSRQATSTRRVVLIPLIVYLFAIAVPSGNWTFGWYAQPLYPWLCLGAGAFFAEAFERPSLWHGMLIVGVLVMYGVNFTMTPDWAKNSEHWQLLRRSVTVYVALTMAPYALYEAFPKARTTLWLGRITTALALLGFLGLSGYIVTHYDAIRYTHEDFDRMKFFDR